MFQQNSFHWMKKKSLQNSFKRRCNSLTALTKYGYELSILEKIPPLANSKSLKKKILFINIDTDLAKTRFL